MSNMQMYEFARDAIVAHEHIQPEDKTQPDVLWVGGMLEIKRAVVWLSEKLFMVTYNINTEETVVDIYVREA